MTIHHPKPIAHALWVLLVILSLLARPMTAYAGAAPALQLPETGDLRVTGSAAVIDKSHLSRGYVMCRYTGKADRAAVQVEKAGSGKVYTHYISAVDGFTAIPFTEGDGRYTVDVLERQSGKTYAYAARTSVEVLLEDAFLPFLSASHIVRFDADSESVEKGRQLTEEAGGDAEAIAAVHDYLAENIRYDKEKAANLPTGYVSNPDAVLRDGMGICVDYAALMAAMLRSQGIPTKVIYGTTPGGEYHCWVRVYSTDAGKVGKTRLKVGAWTLLDPTFAAGFRNTPSWAPDASGYTIAYTY